MLRNFVDFDQPCGKILQLLITQALEIWQPVLRVLMEVPNSQLTTNFSAKYQLTTIFFANSQLTTNLG